MRWRGTLLGLATLVAASAVDAAGQTPVASAPIARISPAFIGAWKVSLAESHFPAGRVPKMQVRIFEVTADGKLLGHYLAATSGGALTGGHWTSALDGRWSPEFTRAGGAVPYAMVRYVVTDPATLEMQATKRGVPFETGRFALSPDGHMLTVTFHVDGATSVAIYHPWTLVD